MLPKRHPYDPLATSLKRSVRTSAPEINSKIIESELFWMICQDSRGCDSVCEVEAAVSDDHYHAECSPGLAALWATLVLDLCVEVDHFEIK